VVNQADRRAGHERVGAPQPLSVVQKHALSFSCADRATNCGQFAATMSMSADSARF
jgi:hypothetical protein